MAFILRRLLSPFTGRRTDGSPFIFKCLAVTCVFLLIEGVFIVHRWIKASEITTWELENMIPIEEGNNQVGGNIKVYFTISSDKLCCCFLYSTGETSFLGKMNCYQD